MDCHGGINTSMRLKPAKVEEEEEPDNLPLMISLIERTIMKELYEIADSDNELESINQQSDAKEEDDEKRDKDDKELSEQVSSLDFSDPNIFWGTEAIGDDHESLVSVKSSDDIAVEESKSEEEWNRYEKSSSETTPPYKIEDLLHDGSRDVDKESAEEEFPSSDEEPEEESTSIIDFRFEEPKMILHRANHEERDMIIMEVRKRIIRDVVKKAHAKYMASLHVPLTALCMHKAWRRLIYLYTTEPPKLPQSAAKQWIPDEPPECCDEGWTTNILPVEIVPRKDDETLSTHTQTISDLVPNFLTKDGSAYGSFTSDRIQDPEYESKLLKQMKDEDYPLEERKRFLNQLFKLRGKSFLTDDLEESLKKGKELPCSSSSTSSSASSSSISSAEEKEKLSSFTGEVTQPSKSVDKIDESSTPYTLEEKMHEEKSRLGEPPKVEEELEEEEADRLLGSIKAKKSKYKFGRLSSSISGPPRYLHHSYLQQRYIHPCTFPEPRVSADFQLLPVEGDSCRAKRFKRTLVKVKDPLPNEEIAAQDLYSTITEQVQETLNQADPCGPLIRMEDSIQN